MASKKHEAVLHRVRELMDGLDEDMLLVGLDTDAVPDPPLADDVPLEAEPPEPDLWPVHPLPVPPAFPPPLPMLFPS